MSLIKKKVLFSIALLISSSKIFSASNVVTVRGYGENENAALSAAKKTAIAKICGETILGGARLQSDTEKNIQKNTSGDSSISLNSTSKSKDDSLSLVGGSVKSFKILSKGEDNLGRYAEIEAVVSECKKGDVVSTLLNNQQLASQLQKINSEIKKLDNNGIISNPKSLAEKYHNARMLSQRGEIDLALKAYEQVINEPLTFADPIQDMVTLSKRIYGLEGSKKYLEKSLAHLKGRPAYFYAIQLLDQEIPTPGGWNIAKNNIDIFPPHTNLYLSALNNSCFELPSGKINHCLENITKLDGIDIVLKKLHEKIKSGEYLNYFIDSNRAEKEIAIPERTISTMRKSMDLQQKLDAIDKKYNARN